MTTATVLLLYAAWLALVVVFALRSRRRMQRTEATLGAFVRRLEDRSSTIDLCGECAASLRRQYPSYVRVVVITSDVPSERQGFH